MVEKILEFLFFHREKKCCGNVILEISKDYMGELFTRLKYEPNSLKSEILNLPDGKANRLKKVCIKTAHICSEYHTLCPHFCRDSNSQLIAR